METDKTLESTGDRGWLTGFWNMLQKENARWWNTKSIIVKLIMWTLIINSLVAGSMYVTLQLAPHGFDTNGFANNITSATATADSLNLWHQTVSAGGLYVFFLIAGQTMFIGAVIFAHDSILKERESGTAAWLLSKPVSRKAFVLSKVLAQSFGMLILILLVQAIIAYILCSFVMGSLIPVLPFLAGVGLIGLEILFYQILALGLGAFFQSRSVTLGVPIIIGMGSGIAMTFKPELHYFVPSKLTDYASTIATGFSVATPATSNALPSDFYIPIIVTAIWVVVFIAATVARFELIEL